MILDRMEGAGFSLEVTDAGKLKVYGTLDDSQRDYIRSNKLRLIVALRLRPIAEEQGHDLGDLLNWYRGDVADLSGKSDQDLNFIVSDYIGKQSIYRKPVPHCVKCSACRHFVRSGHPHLGKCSAGANQSAPAGFWDEHLRGCDKFIETTGAIKCTS